MNRRKIFIGSALFAGIAFAYFYFGAMPRERSLPEGYFYVHFPISGHRYIIAPGGIKRVGQEVISYEIKGTIITGVVRRILGGDDIRTFHLDLKTHVVVLDPPLNDDSASSNASR
jgi:hypothetical protein